MSTPTTNTVATPGTPGSVTGAAVAGYVEAGMLVLGGLFVIASAWIASSFLGAGFGRAYTFVGLFVIAMGVLYAVAARRVQTGRGRSLLIALTLVTVVLQVNSALWSDLATGPAVVMLLGLVPPIVAFILSVRLTTAQWIAAHHAP